MSFYEKISKLRKAQGISQEDLAQELNISRQAVYKWETGQSMPDIDNLILLSKKFNVTVDYLLNDSIEEFCSTPINTRSRQYGKVFRTSLTPADVDLEKDNTRRTKNEANKIKIRKLSIILSFICGLILVGIGVISLWRDSGSGFPRTQIILCAV